MIGAPRMGEWPSGHERFAPRNIVALKHGAFSDRAIAAKCDTLAPGFADWLAEHAPWAAADEFAPQRLNYLRSLSVVELLTESVVQTAATKGAASVPLRRFETLLASLRGERDALAQLGLTARTKAQMALTVASTGATLADLAARGAETSGFARQANQRGPASTGGDFEEATE